MILPDSKALTEILRLTGLTEIISLKEVHKTK